MAVSKRCNVIAMIFFSLGSLVLIVASSLHGQQGTVEGNAKNSEGKSEAPAKKGAVPAGAVEIRFVDDSTMKLQLRDASVELETSYGKLLIPIADIQRIEIGRRVSEEVRKKIEHALGELGHTDFRRRQTASNELIALKEKAYPALLAVSRSPDTEAARRVEEILDKIRDTVATEILEIPPYDVVHTATSKIAGLIKADSLRVVTLPFGEQQVRLSDVRSLRSQSLVDTPSPDDGSIVDAHSFHMYRNAVGKTFSVRVTGPPAAVGMQMGVWGTDVYTMDSSIEAAAVHAGVIQPGKTGIIRVTILGPQAGFMPSVRNGIASSPNGPYPGFRIEQPKGGNRRKD